MLVPGNLANSAGPAHLPGQTQGEQINTTMNAIQFLQYIVICVPDVLIYKIPKSFRNSLCKVFAPYRRKVFEEGNKK